MSVFLSSIDQLSSFPERLYTRPALKKLFLQHSGIPEWLLTRCQKEGGDLAETLARCWPGEGVGLQQSPQDFIRETFPKLIRPGMLLDVWNESKTPERIWVNRLLLGYKPPPPPVFIDPGLPRTEVQAELMYALLSGNPEFSFGLRSGQELTVFARITVDHPEWNLQLLQFIDQNTLEKKGPVRVVRRGLVGVISYQGLSPSNRHKSGFKVEGARLESLFPAGGLWQADAFTDV